MQLDEEIEKAFEAGAKWALENAYCAINDEAVGFDREINDGIQEYINGNRESDQSPQFLGKG